MSKVKVYEFDPQVYPRRLWIAVTNKNEIKDFVEDLGDDGGDYGAITQCVHHKNKNLGGILIKFADLKALNRADYVAHEATHAALKIFNYVGAKIDFYNQEPFAYLVGWIAECCDKVKQEEINKLNK